MDRRTQKPGIDYRSCGPASRRGREHCWPRRGFTLIELLVVVAVIALLISILLPSLSAAREQARRTVCSSNLRSIAQAFNIYGNENRDFVPQHQGTEPDYVYVRGSTLIQAPGNQWHLGELILRQMNMDPPKRNGTNNTFLNEDLARSKEAGKIFYCPSTPIYNTPPTSYPSWSNPSQFGSFMDYAQFWGFIGPVSRRAGGQLRAVTAEGKFLVLDDDQNVIVPDPTSDFVIYSLPYTLSQDRFLRDSAGGRHAEVPVIADYMTSFGRSTDQLRTEFRSGALRPQGGNHNWTNHTPNSGATVFGGNFAFIDGHVEWRSNKQVRPRLAINRTFTDGSDRPTYWW
ncbi:MAG: prepilin-type N-terminal cleavage/methylation domain-containing protein [Planctomycetia bacterium]|nr:MAG: prepilin-type N-terminal cleavage/methylation domain-containing protein [Planctomycetia bacterium]